MDNKTSILIADSSAAMRGLLRAVLGAEEEFKLVATETNSRDAVASFFRFLPDLVVMDADLAESNRVNVLEQVRQYDSKIPVIVMRSADSHADDANAARDLSGASAVIDRPADLSYMKQAVERFRNTAMPVIRDWAGCARELRELRNVNTAKGGSAVQSDSETASAAPTCSVIPPPEIVAIGSSTGGPDALNRVLRSLPADFPVPIVIAQHMPPKFTRLLAERLEKTCHLRVEEAENGSVLEAGRVWVAPGDFHMMVHRRGSRGIILLDQEPPENSCRPAVDVLFRSVAKVYGNRSLGVVLTGMGQDGLEGCRAIRNAGGSVLVQDERSCVVHGMPRAVFENDLANENVPIEFMYRKILDRVLGVDPQHHSAAWNAPTAALRPV